MRDVSRVRGRHTGVTFFVARIIEPPWKRNYKFVEHRVFSEFKALVWLCWQPGF